MKLWGALLALFVAVFAVAPAAEAKTMFGEQDNFNTLLKLDISADQIEAYGLPKEWAANTELVGHSTTLFVLAGVFVSDKGYAIKTTGSDDYWELDAEMIKNMQEVGLLPTPLPPATIDTFDLIFGYSLWIVLGGLALFYGAKAIFFKKKPEAAPPASPTAE